MTIDNTPTPSIAVPRDVDGFAVIGRTRHELMGIRYNTDAGGNTAGTTGGTENNGETNAEATGQTGASGAGEKTADRTIDPKDAEAPFGRDKNGRAFTAAESTAFIASLRQEAQNNRTKAEQEATARAKAEADRANVLAALGFGTDGKELPTDPNELSSQVTAATSALTEQRQDNVVLRLAPKLDADADKLLDRMSFVTALRKIDAGNRADIEALITKTLEQDATLKVNTSGSSSGGQGHSGTTSTTGRKSMHDAVKAGIGTKPTR